MGRAGLGPRLLLGLRRLFLSFLWPRFFSFFKRFFSFLCLFFSFLSRPRFSFFLTFSFRLARGGASDSL